jgi:hypothetical protein
MENVGLFYDHLAYFTAIWYILRPFGTFYSHLVYSFLFLVSCTNKNPATLPSSSNTGVLKFVTFPLLWKTAHRAA